jgi:hypothetical protein
MRAGAFRNIHVRKTGGLRGGTRRSQFQGLCSGSQYAIVIELQHAVLKHSVLARPASSARTLYQQGGSEGKGGGGFGRKRRLLFPMPTARIW